MVGHDEIYSPRVRDNELKSAEDFSNQLEKRGISWDLILKIKQIILMTDHKTRPKNIDEQFACDIDLSIFGKSNQIYEEYSRNIRREYSWVPERLYRDKRKDILNYFLERDRIYYTDFFNSRYEEMARDNISDEIKKLEMFL